MMGEVMEWFRGFDGADLRLVVAPLMALAMRSRLASRREPDGLRERIKAAVEIKDG